MVKKDILHIKQQDSTMNQDHEYQLPSIYSQIPPPVSVSSHRPPFLIRMRRSVTFVSENVLESKFSPYNI